MTGKRRWLPFIAGVLAGVLLSTMLLFSAVLIGGRQTWLLRVNTHSISDRMEDSAQIMVRELLPSYIENLKGEVPNLITIGVTNQFNDAQFQIGGEQFALPQQFVDRMEENYRKSLEEAIHDLLDTLPLDVLSEELGAEIISLVNNSVYAEYNTQRVEVELIEGLFAIPVMIEIIDVPGQRNFSLQIYTVSN